MTSTSSTPTYPLTLCCASRLPPLNYTGFTLRAPASNPNPPQHMKRNAATPSLLKSIVRLSVSDFANRIQTFNTTIPTVDLAGRNDLPIPLRNQLRPSSRRNPSRGLQPLRTVMQVSVASDVGDSLRHSLLPISQYLFRMIYDKRESTIPNGPMPPNAFHWKPLANFYFDPKFRVDGGYGVPIAPSLQGFIWEPKETPAAKKKPEVKTRAKGKGKAKATSPAPEDVPPPQPRIFLAVCPRWILTTKAFKEMVAVRKLSESISPTKPFGETRSEIADNILAKLTDHCVHDRIRHVIITSHDCWSFGSFTPDFSELTLTPPIPLTSAPPELPSPNRRRDISIQPTANDSNHLAEDGLVDAPFSIMQSMLYMMESVSRMAEAGPPETWAAALPCATENETSPEASSSKLAEAEDDTSNAGPSNTSGRNASLRKRKRGPEAAEAGPSPTNSITPTEISVAATTYDGSDAGPDDVAHLPRNHFKRLRRSGRPIVIADASAPVFNGPPVPLPAAPVLAPIPPPTQMYRSPSPPPPTDSSPPPYGPPSRSPSPAADDGSQHVQDLAHHLTSSSSPDPEVLLDNSQSGLSTSVPQSSVATVRHFQGFGPVGRDKCVRAADDSLKRQRLRDASKGKRRLRGERIIAEEECEKEKEEMDVEDLVDGDQDENGTGRAALAVARAR